MPLCVDLCYRHTLGHIKSPSSRGSHISRVFEFPSDRLFNTYRLVRTDENNKELKIEMSELRARHKVELEKVSRDKNREMESVHERVKQALSKKEEHLHSLREQYEAALKRADHLEMLLEQQRKQLLKK